MSGIGGVLDIARVALFTQKDALETTGHNIANVNTPGYSVQKTLMQPRMAVLMSYGWVGTGVETTEIQRTYSQFLNDQVNEKNSEFYKWEAQKDILGLLETEFNESGGYGINHLLNDFWNGWEDVADNPEGLAERTALIAKATTLADAFNSKGRLLTSVAEDLNVYIKAAVNEVNRYVEQLADLNKKIIAMETQNFNANDIRDERDLILEKLTEFLPIRYLESNNGTLSVFLPSGYTLVEGTSSWELTTELDAQNDLRVKWNGSADLTATLDQGRLGGWLELRDSIILGYQETLDSVAAHLATMVNDQHDAGFDLLGAAGGNFFAEYGPSSKIVPDSDNSGGITLSAAFIGGTYDPNALTGDSYNIAFTATNVTITNRSTGTQLINAAYVSGATHTFEGLDVTITDAATGAPQAGDSFIFMPNRAMAENLAVDSSIAADSRTIAAAQAAGAVGDNRNGLAIANLRYQTETILQQQGSLGEIYDSALVGEIGTDVGNAVNRYEFNEVLVQQIRTQRDSVAGVSLDEEMTNMIRFQHAYSAAAKLIAVADEMLQTLLSTKR